jgi:hypothetical protein
MDEADTVVTPVLLKAVSKWRKWAPWALSSIVCIGSGLFSYSVKMGHTQADGEMIARSVTQLTTEVNAMRGEVRQLSDKQIEMNGKLDAVDDNIQDFKGWKDRVTGVAETVSVPKLQGHRTHHP